MVDGVLDANDTRVVSAESLQLVRVSLITLVRVRGGNTEAIDEMLGRKRDVREM